MLERFRTADSPSASPVELLRTSASLFFDFCVEDPARFQLLFLRTTPGFEPSAESFELAQVALDRLAAVLAEAGMGAPEQVDLWTVLMSGLASQQVSNDPGRGPLAPAARAGRGDVPRPAPAEVAGQPVRARSRWAGSGLITWISVPSGR
jgi:hypothetical protein